MEFSQDSPGTTVGTSLTFIGPPPTPKYGEKEARKIEVENPFQQTQNGFREQNRQSPHARRKARSHGTKVSQSSQGSKSNPELRIDVSYLIPKMQRDFRNLGILLIILSFFLPLLLTLAEKTIGASGSLGTSFVAYFVLISAFLGVAYWRRLLHVRRVERLLYAGKQRFKFDKRGITLPVLLLDPDTQALAIRSGRPHVGIPWSDVRLVMIQKKSWYFFDLRDECIKILLKGPSTAWGRRDFFGGIMGTSHPHVWATRRDIQKFDRTMLKALRHFQRESRFPLDTKQAS